MQEAKFRVVEELGFLPLLHAFDGEAELLAQLIVIVVIKICDPAVQADHGLHHAQLILARRFLVIHERALQLGFAIVVRSDVDPRLSITVVLLPVFIAETDQALEARAQLGRALERRP